MLAHQGFVNRPVYRDRRLAQAKDLSKDFRAVTLAQRTGVNHTKIVEHRLAPLQRPRRLVEKTLSKHLYGLVAEADVDRQRMQRRIFEQPRWLIR